MGQKGTEEGRKSTKDVRRVRLPDQQAEGHVGSCVGSILQTFTPGRGWGYKLGQRAETASSSEVPVGSEDLVPVPSKAFQIPQQTPQDSREGPGWRGLQGLELSTRGGGTWGRLHQPTLGTPGTPALAEMGLGRAVLGGDSQDQVGNIPEASILPFSPLEC